MLDSILERTFGQFRKVRREYEAIMRQRNALLKQIREGEAQRSDLQYWNKTFATTTILYHMYRMKWVEFLREELNILERFLPKYQFEYVYSSKLIEQSREYNL